MIRGGYTSNTSSYYTDISRYHSFCFWEDLTGFKSLNPRRMVTVIHSSIIPYGLSVCKLICLLVQMVFLSTEIIDTLHRSWRCDHHTITYDTIFCVKYFFSISEIESFRVKECFVSIFCGVGNSDTGSSTGSCTSHFPSTLFRICTRNILSEISYFFSYFSQEDPIG